MTSSTSSRLFGAILIFAIAGPAAAQDAPLQQRVEAALRASGPGTRFGLVVSDEDGRELVAIAPDERFIPASNTKMFTTAAAFYALALDGPDKTGGATVRLDGQDRGTPDIVLTGHGDARLSSAADCAVDCLATLADAIAARTKRVHDVVGDDTLYPDQRWSPGMSWNNIPTRSGTATSALALDDNELPLRVTPSTPGQPPSVDLPAYYSIDNRAMTVASGATSLDFDREPNGYAVRLTGTIVKGADPELLHLGIDDPARYAAWTFRAMLEKRGVRVTGSVVSRHRPLTPGDDPDVRRGAPPARAPEPPVLARLTSPPLYEDLIHINKVSQNLHAELMLRRLGLLNGSGSIADGIAVVQKMLAAAGVPRADYDFSDGSGMSTYNRVTPRSVVIFLRWIAAHPWGAAWRTTLPRAGVEGTLGKRFRGTPLENNLSAKTGTLNAANALSGYMIAKSGRTLTFAAFANDVPEGVNATKAMDAALELIAAEN